MTTLILNDNSELAKFMFGSPDRYFDEQIDDHYYNEVNYLDLFKRAFPVFNNVTVCGDSINYSHQTYRPGDTLQMAKDLIRKEGWPLIASYNSVFETLTVRVA